MWHLYMTLIQPCPIKSEESNCSPDNQLCALNTDDLNTCKITVCTWFPVHCSTLWNLLWISWLALNIGSDWLVLADNAHSSGRHIGPEDWREALGLFSVSCTFNWKFIIKILHRGPDPSYARLRIKATMQIFF